MRVCALCCVYDVLMTSYTGVFMTSYTGFAGFRFQVEFTFGLYGRSLMCGSAPSSLSFCAFLFIFIFIFIFTFGSYGRSLMCGSAPRLMSLNPEPCLHLVCMAGP